MDINNAAELKAAIALLEKNVDFKKRILIDQYYTTCESLKPANLIKSSVKRFVAKPGIVNKLVGVGVGIISRNIIPGKGSGFIRKSLISAVKFAASKLNKRKQITGPSQAIITNI